MKAKLDQPPLWIYKLGLLLALGATLGFFQDFALGEVVVWSRETHLSSIPEVKTVPPQPMPTPSPTPHPYAYRIDQFLKRMGSPMAGLGSVYMAAANQTGVDPFLMVAISGKESSFGKYACQNNAWGIANCRLGFSSYREGIEYLSKLLASSRYKGKSLRQLAYTYCPPQSGCDTQKWIYDVSFFWEQLKRPPLVFNTTSSP